MNDTNTKTFTLKQRDGTPHTFVVDADRYDEVMKHRWSVTGYNSNYYAVCYRKHDHISLQNFLMGSVPRGMMVDHKDNNTYNNRVSNLRICTRAENNRNRLRPLRAKSPYKGVAKIGKKWRAQCGFNGKIHYLGTHDTPEAAHAAYCDFARQHHGEFFNPGTFPTEAQS